MAVTVTEVQESAGSYSGTWTTQTDSAASGGTYTQSSTAGATATFTASGRAIYLLTTQQQTAGAFMCTVDGTSYGGGSSFAANGASGGNRHRVLMPLARRLTDGPHTVVITSASTTPVNVDSLLVVSGTAAAPSAGVIATVGDSTTIGYGLASPALASWPSRLGWLLGAKLSRQFSVNNLGVSGDALAGADSGHVGGMYRLYSQALPLTPEVLTLMFGINDFFLRTIEPGVFAAQLLAALCFIEDAFPTSQMAVVVSTPTYLAPLSLASVPAGNNSNYYGGNAADNWKLGLEIIKQIVAMFSWATQGYAYEAMDETDSLVYPNGGFDSTHPGDAGHSVVAVEMFRAVMGRFAKIGKA
jgi:lysophospholipase L1-like esterase